VNAPLVSSALNRMRPRWSPRSKKSPVSGPVIGASSSLLAGPAAGVMPWRASRAIIRSTIFVSDSPGSKPPKSFKSAKKFSKPAGAARISRRPVVSADALQAVGHAARSKRTAAGSRRHHLIADLDGDAAVEHVIGFVLVLVNMGQHDRARLHRDDEQRKRAARFRCGQQARSGDASAQTIVNGAAGVAGGRAGNMSGAGVLVVVRVRFMAVRFLLGATLRSWFALRPHLTDASCTERERKRVQNREQKNLKKRRRPS
jgi:hypothetical protein